jgi:hypothetical protein
LAGCRKIGTIITIDLHPAYQKLLQAQGNFRTGATAAYLGGSVANLTHRQKSTTIAEQLPSTG